MNYHLSYFYAKLSFKQRILNREQILQQLNTAHSERKNMNRYKLIFNSGKQLLLYGKCQPDLKISSLEDILGKVQSVELYTDTSHLEYISKIKQQSEFLGYHRNREVYKCPYNKGYLIIQFSKDPEDNIYYDYAQYMEYKAHRFTEPILKTVSTPKEVYNLISQGCPEYIVYSHRYYGEPKLSKPKELKGVKQICSVDFIPNKCKTPIFIKDNDLWVKHSDYFSSVWRPPTGERLDMPMSYYAKKYFNKNKNEKFIYPDCWGSIILRNEAWILIKNIVPIIRTELSTKTARTIMELQVKNKYSPSDLDKLNCEWNNYWGRVVNEIQNIIGVKK